MLMLNVVTVFIDKVLEFLLVWGDDVSILVQRVFHGAGARHELRDLVRQTLRHTHTSLQRGLSRSPQIWEKRCWRIIEY